VLRPFGVNVVENAGQRWSDLRSLRDRGRTDAVPKGQQIELPMARVPSYVPGNSKSKIRVCHSSGFQQADGTTFGDGK